MRWCDIIKQQEGYLLVTGSMGTTSAWLLWADA